MITTFFGIKQKQTRVYDEDGKSVVVTEVMVEPATVTQVRTQEVDGYNAVQLGLYFKADKKVTKPMQGLLKKTGLGTNFKPRYIREIRLDAPAESKVNDKISVDQIFKVGDAVQVTATSRAKGFQGVVKRHGFRGGPRTHGQSDRERAPGSIGQTTTPGRVYKGKRMAGRTGNETVTIRGLKVVSIDTEKKLVRISGLVPGRVNRLLTITKA